MDAAVAFMAQMERLYTVNLAVAVDEGNDGGGGRGGKAGAPSGNGIACINCQVVVVTAAVEEEEEEGVVDRDGNHMANGNRGPVVHGNLKDGNKSAAPRTRRMTTTTAMTAMGGDRDCPTQGNLDHHDNSAPDCYQSGGGSKIWDGSGGSSGGRGSGNSNRKKWRRRKYKGKGESTPMMVDLLQGEVD